MQRQRFFAKLWKNYWNDSTSWPALLVPALVVWWCSSRGLGLFMGATLLRLFRNLVLISPRSLLQNYYVFLSQYYLDNNSGHITAKIMFNVEQLKLHRQNSLKTIVQQGLIPLRCWVTSFIAKRRLTHGYSDFFTPLIGLLIRKLLSVCASSLFKCKTPWVIKS